MKTVVGWLGLFLLGLAAASEPSSSKRPKKPVSEKPPRPPRRASTRAALADALADQQLNVPSEWIKESKNLFGDDLTVKFLDRLISATKPADFSLDIVNVRYGKVRLYDRAAGVEADFDRRMRKGVSLTSRTYAIPTTTIYEMPNRLCFYSGLLKKCVYSLRLELRDGNETVVVDATEWEPTVKLYLKESINKHQGYRMLEWLLSSCGSTLIHRIHGHEDLVSIYDGEKEAVATFGLERDGVLVSIKYSVQYEIKIEVELDDIYTVIIINHSTSPVALAFIRGSFNGPTVVDWQRPWPKQKELELDPVTPQASMWIGRATLAKEFMKNTILHCNKITWLCVLVDFNVTAVFRPGSFSIFPFWDGKTNVGVTAYQTSLDNIKFSAAESYVRTDLTLKSDEHSTYVVYEKKMLNDSRAGSRAGSRAPSSQRPTPGPPGSRGPSVVPQSPAAEARAGWYGSPSAGHGIHTLTDAQLARHMAENPGMYSPEPYPQATSQGRNPFSSGYRHQSPVNPNEFYAAAGIGYYPQSPVTYPAGGHAAEYGWDGGPAAFGGWTQDGFEVPPRSRSASRALSLNDAEDENYYLGTAWEWPQKIETDPHWLTREPEPRPTLEWQQISARYNVQTGSTTANSFDSWMPEANSFFNAMLWAVFGVPPIRRFIRTQGSDGSDDLTFLKLSELFAVFEENEAAGEPSIEAERMELPYEWYENRPDANQFLTETIFRDGRPSALNPRFTFTTRTDKRCQNRKCATRTDERSSFILTVPWNSRTTLDRQLNEMATNQSIDHKCEICGRSETDIRYSTYDMSRNDLLIVLLDSRPNEADDEIELERFNFERQNIFGSNWRLISVVQLNDVGLYTAARRNEAKPGEWLTLDQFDVRRTTDLRKATQNFEDISALFFQKIDERESRPYWSFKSGTPAVHSSGERSSKPQTPHRGHSKTPGPYEGSSKHQAPPSRHSSKTPGPYSGRSSQPPPYQSLDATVRPENQPVKEPTRHRSRTGSKTPTAHDYGKFNEGRQ